MIYLSLFYVSLKEKEIGEPKASDHFQIFLVQKCLKKYKTRKFNKKKILKKKSKKHNLNRISTQTQTSTPFSFLFLFLL